MRDNDNKNTCQSTDLHPSLSFFWPIVIFWQCTLWPIVCIGLGIVVGTTLGVLITALLFLITALWLPFRIAKLLHVTSTTQECFQGFLGPILRLFVVFVIPIVPACSWIGGTFLCATIGTLFLIGKTTKRIFLYEFQESIQILHSNLTLQPNTTFGDLAHRYHELLVNDRESHPSIYLVKGLLTTIPGLFVATVVSAPYSLAILSITIYRLPINMYQTSKIAIRTVLLRWDLRLVVLGLLPVIHLLFPLLTMVGALLGCFFWTWGATSDHIFHGKHPGEILDRLVTSLSEYHKVHQDFVEIHCLPYDHPTGIPDGWDGRTYGIAVERLLRFQRDLLICCILIVLELPICFLSTLVISILKYIPTCIHLWSKYVTKYCCNRAMLGCWPFHLLALLLLPLGVLVCHLFLILLALLNVPFHVLQFYLDHVENWLKEAWNLQVDLLCCHDQLTGALLNDYQFFHDLSQRRQEDRERQIQAIATTHATMVASTTQSMWDQVQKQCIQTTSNLLKEGYITQDQVTEMDPSVIQSIPSVAIWTVLIASCSSHHPVGPKEIRWEVDGTVCKQETHVTNDPIARFLWPMVMDLKHFLSTTNSADTFSPDNIQIVTALLCSNAEVNTPRVEQSLLLRTNLDSTQQQHNNQIRVRITALVLALLRVRPFQERMNDIFMHDYGPIRIMDYPEDVGASCKESDSDKSPATPRASDATGIFGDMGQTDQDTNLGTRTGLSTTYGSITETDEFRA